MFSFLVTWLISCRLRRLITWLVTWRVMWRVRPGLVMWPSHGHVPPRFRSHGSWHAQPPLWAVWGGGAYLAMCVCATVLRCHTHNLLRCGLFEGANLAVHVCAAVLRCHMHNLLLSGLFHFTFSYILHDSVHSYSFWSSLVSYLIIATHFIHFLVFYMILFTVILFSLWLVSYLINHDTLDM